MSNARSVWKGPYVSWSLIRHWVKDQENSIKQDAMIKSPVSYQLSLESKKPAKPSTNINRKNLSNTGEQNSSSKVFANNKPKNKKVFKVWARNSTILPSFVGYNFQIYNGKSFTKITIAQDMVGHKFGEFSMTRKGSSKKNQKKGKK